MVIYYTLWVHNSKIFKTANTPFSWALKKSPEVWSNHGLTKMCHCRPFWYFIGQVTHFHDLLKTRTLQAEQLGYEWAWFPSVTCLAWPRNLKWQLLKCKTVECKYEGLAPPGLGSELKKLLTFQGISIDFHHERYIDSIQDKRLWVLKVLHLNLGTE